MVSKVSSCAIHGLTANKVTVEVHLTNGLPGSVILGLPDTTLRESILRVKSAVMNSHIEWPRKKITINLSPSNLKKHGGFFDLALAAAVLISSDDLLPDDLSAIGFLGELMLNGKIIGQKGILIAVEELVKSGCQQVVVPKEYYFEASLVPGAHVIAVSSLFDLYNFIKYGEIPTPPDPVVVNQKNVVNTTIDNVTGQQQAKLALTIAAAGRHNLLMLGEPGVGKSLLANCLPSLLDDLPEDKAVASCRIKSLVSKKPLTKLNLEPPFRKPHHSVSVQGLLGGGSSKITPGEVTFAHNGVLFLDEIGEFSPRTLDSLRQVIENKEITIIRQSGAYTFPADFMLLACGNPCPCGYGNKKCICSEMTRFKYFKKISGPFLDRCDLVIHLDKTLVTLNADQPFEQQSGWEYKRQSEASNKNFITHKKALQLIKNASNAQQSRYENETFSKNSSLPVEAEHKYIKLNSDCKELLQQLVKDENNKVSLRGISRVKKVAKTIADMYEKDEVGEEEISLALALRNF